MAAGMRGGFRFDITARNQTGPAWRGVENSIQRTQRAAQGLQRTMGLLLGAAGIGLSVQGFQRMVSGALQSAEALADMSRQANAGIEALQELRFVADQNGSSADVMDRGLRRLSSTMGDLLVGKTDEATRALERMGLAERIRNGEIRTSDQLFRAMVASLEQVEDANVRASLASAVFEQRLGGELRQALSLGSAELDRFSQRARESGQVIEESLVEQGARANARLREMRNAMGTSLNRAILTNAEALQQLAEALGEVMEAAIRAGAALARAMNLGRGMAGRDLGAAAGRMEDLAGRMARGEVRGAGMANTLGIDLRSILGNLQGEALRRQLEEVLTPPPGVVRSQMERVQAELRAAEILQEAARELRNESRAARDDTGETPGTTGTGSGTGGGTVSTSSPARAARSFDDILNDVALTLQSQANPALLDNVDAYLHEIETRQKLLLEQDKTLERIDEAEEAFHRFNLTLETVALNGVKELEQAFVDFVTTGELSFDNFARSVLANLARMAFQQAIGNPLQQAIGGALGGIFGGGKASGGMVRAGSAIRVGERGPETLLMGAPGYVDPGNGGGVTVINRFSFDLSGSVMTPELIAQMNEMVRASEEQAITQAVRISSRNTQGQLERMARPSLSARSY